MDLKMLVSRGRGPMLEFMPEPDASSLAELIVAFANGVGGTILIGLDEKGRVHSDAAEDLEPILARALRMCEPPFRAIDLPEWHSEETPWGEIVTIVVKPTPYQVSVEGKEVYVRSGTMNIRLSPEQLPRDRYLRGVFSFEEEALPGATWDDFDEEILQEYERKRIERGPSGETLTRTELLRDAGAIDPAGTPTVAGILLFGKRPQQFLPQTGVVIVRFKGTSIHQAAGSERYIRRVELNGPAARLIERAWEVLFEEIHGQAYLEGLERQETFEYPPEAVREAMVNAICHRDYAISGQRIEIRLFDDRLEIMSPGGLPGHITLENILDEHYSRNPRLVRGLYYWGYIEELGQGIDIIYEAMQRDNHPPPEFRATETSFTVILRNAIDEIELLYGEILNPRQMRALRFLQAHDRITNSQYRELCPEVSAETVRLDLKDLVQKGILLKIGEKRGTYYVLK
ncbi:MAG: putative DNA binding domain-containing protein [Anaerolineae bacterium]|nr:putative DNA binding domain-containing protein [Anaerolineae bacterium]